MAAPATLKVTGFKEFSAALKEIDKSYGRELAKANKAAADVIVPVARARVAGLSKMQAKVADSIKSAAVQKGAVIRAGGSDFPALLAMGALLGSKRYPQFPAWVGNDWVPGGPGGPYGINAAIAEKEPDAVNEYVKAIDALYRKAFTD